MPKTFTVIYRTGGYANPAWHKVLGRFDRAGANSQIAELAKAGYKALAHDTKALESIGMPVGHCRDTKCPCEKGV